MDTLQINADSLQKEGWSEQEKNNVELISDFITHLMNKHDFEYILRKFGGQAYVQHNRSIPDGLEALVNYVADLVKRYPEYSYDVKHIYADGDFVIFHSHATLKAEDRGNDKKGLNIFDTWRLKDGQIADHWDALQPMDGFMRFYNLLTGGKIRNGNGVY